MKNFKLLKKYNLKYSLRISKLCTISLRTVNWINSAQATILDLKLYVVMGIILIYSVIPIQFEVEYYIDIITNVGLKIGLFKY